MPRLIPLLLVVSLLLALAVAMPGSAVASKHCKAIRFAGKNYPVWVSTGNTACSTARKTLLSFMRTKRAPKRWICFRGYGGVVFAASCARKPGTGRSAILRAYNPGFKGP